MLERFREEKMLDLEREIERLTVIWRAEEMEKHKDSYNESILLDRIIEFRVVKTRAIDQLLQLEETFFLDMLSSGGLDDDIDEEEEEPITEWLTKPTQANALNILLYIYYLLYCCKDSAYLYYLIFYWIFNYPVIPEIVPFIKTNHVLTEFVDVYLLIFL